MRIGWVVFALALLSCGSGPKEPALPQSISPGWTRSAVNALNAGQFPKLIHDAGIEKGWETQYRSADDAVVTVDLYAVRSSAQSLDLVQRWRAEPNHAQFPTEHFLLDVAWQGAKHDELASLVRSLPTLVEKP